MRCARSGIGRLGGLGLTGGRSGLLLGVAGGVGGGGNHDDGLGL